MEEIPKPRKREKQDSWKYNVDQDLRRLLDRKGVVGAFLIARNGETVAQVFQDRESSETGKHRESAYMQLVKKVTPVVMGMRNLPLRRTMFETSEGSVIFYSTENGVVGCILDRDYDLVSIMLDVRTAGDMICCHLNNAELDGARRDDLLKENREEFRVMNAELLKQIERHFGPVTTEQLIQRTVR